MWQVLSYRRSPLHYAGTEQREYPTEIEANTVAGALRRTAGYFCVEVRPPDDPPYFWLGEGADHG